MGERKKEKKGVRRDFPLETEIFLSRGKQRKDQPLRDSARRKGIQKQGRKGGGKGSRRPFEEEKKKKNDTREEKRPVPKPRVDLQGETPIPCREKHGFFNAAGGEKEKPIFDGGRGGKREAVKDTLRKIVKAMKNNGAARGGGTTSSRKKTCMVPCGSSRKGGVLTEAGKRFNWSMVRREKRGQPGGARGHAYQCAGRECLECYVGERKVRIESKGEKRERSAGAKAGT